MACCVVGLMLVYQLIDAWQRLRRLCGLPARAYGHLLAWHDGQRERRWRPALLVSFVAFEIGLGSVLILHRRDHLQTGDFRHSFVKGPPPEVFTGPVLAYARYPEVLVAQAISDGRDLRLVLYPGHGDGRQSPGSEQLLPGQRYLVEGEAPDSLQADGHGRASLDVDLRGRATLRLVPAT